MVPFTLQRFVIGYSSMLILMVAVSGYSVNQLGKLSDAAHMALKVDQRMIDDSEKLADAFLSEVRYSGQFIVTHAPVHLDQYKQFKADFDRYMAQLKSLAGSSDEVQRLTRADEYHAQYDQLFEKEVGYIKKMQPYGETRYREEKGRLVDYLLREHEALKTDRQKSLQQRIGHIETAALESQKVTLSATLLLLGMGMYFAYCLTGKTSKKGTSSADSHRAMLGIRWHFQTWWKGLGVPK
jgi:CHASE3 domain sensor protein